MGIAIIIVRFIYMIHIPFISVNDKNNINHYCFHVLHLQLYINQLYTCSCYPHYTNVPLSGVDWGSEEGVGKSKENGLFVSFI